MIKNIRNGIGVIREFMSKINWFRVNTKKEGFKWTLNSIIFNNEHFSNGFIDYKLIEFNTDMMTFDKKGYEILDINDIHEISNSVYFFVDRDYIPIHKKSPDNINL